MMWEQEVSQLLLIKHCLYFINRRARHLTLVSITPNHSLHPAPSNPSLSSQLHSDTHRITSHTYLYYQSSYFTHTCWCMQLILQAKLTASSCKTDVFTQILGLLYGFVAVMENSTLLHDILAELKALMQLVEDDTQHEPWSLNVWCHLKLNALTHYESSLKTSVLNSKRLTRGLHCKCNKGWFFLLL